MSLRPLTLVLIAAGNLTWLASSAGTEFRVNTYAYSYQTRPSVARDAVGNFVVVWEGLGAGRVNGSIRGQRYDATGEPQGGEFKVNSYTPPEILYPGMARPMVTSDPAGNFVVVWESWGTEGTDTSGVSIQARRFDSSGTAQGAQFQVNTTTLYAQRYPSVALDGVGNFVVVWQDDTGVGGYLTDRIVRGRRYASTGVPQGGEFEVGTYTTDFQSQPVVASDLAGNFIVVWSSALPPAEGAFVADSDSIQAQRFDNTGTAQGGQFQVSTTTAGYQNFPAVAADNAGNAVVVWRHSLADVGIHWIDNIILGQRYDSAGTPQGGEFQVNSSPTTVFNKDPAVTMDAAGNFVVAWSDYSFEDTNEFIRSEIDIEARRYDNTGTPQGSQFRVSTSPNVDETHPAVASDAAGNFVVVWQSSVGDPDATSPDLDIYGRRYAVSDFPITDQSPGRATVVIRARKQAKFVTKPLSGRRFALPIADPRAVGGSLRIFDREAGAGDDTYALPPGAAWIGLGNPAGSKGFRYVGKGTPSDPCNLILRPTGIKAVCHGDGITLAPPFTGEVGIVLSLGTSDRYCAQLGGNEVKNIGTLTKRKNAPTPGACP